MCKEDQGSKQHLDDLQDLNLNCTKTHDALKQLTVLSLNCLCQVCPWE